MQGMLLRVGLIYRESAAQSRTSFSIQCFFIDQQGRLHLIVNLARLQKIMRISNSTAQVVKAMLHTGDKSISLAKYTVGDIKAWQNGKVLPFTNRSYVQIKEKQTGKQLDLMPILEDEIENFHMLLKNRSNMKNPMLQSHYEELKSKQFAIDAGMFELLKSSEHGLKIQPQTITHMDLSESQKEIVQLNPNLTYLGPIVNGLPEGEGKEILVREGISFNGFFKNGKKNGAGYLVNSHLDTIYCEFVNDELTGI